MFKVKIFLHNLLRFPPSGDRGLNLLCYPLRGIGGFLLFALSLNSTAQRDTTKRQTIDITSSYKPVTSELTTFEDNSEKKKTYWKVWALILFILAIALLILHFTNNKLTNVGNRNKFLIDSAKVGSDM